MIILNILIILALATDIGYGIKVWRANKGRPINQAFSVLTLCLAFWMISILSAVNLGSATLVTFAIRQANVFGMLTQTALGVLLLTVKYPTEKLQQALVRFKWILMINLALIILTQTQFFMTGVTMPPSNTIIPRVAEPKFGMGFPVFFTYNILFFLGLLLQTIFHDLRRAKGVQREELLFILLGCSLSIVFGMALAFILPLLIGSSITAPLAPLGAISLNIVTAYGLITKKAMRAANLFKKIITYIISSILLGILYFATWFISDGLLHTVMANVGQWPHLIATLCLLFTITPITAYLEKISTRTLASDEPFAATLLIQRASHTLQTITTLNDLLASFAEIIQNSIRPKHILILLHSENRFDQIYPCAKIGGAFQIAADDPLAQVLQDQESPFNMEILYRTVPTEKIAAAAETMKRAGCVFAVRIYSKDHLAGMLLLGTRESDRIYSAQEQDALQILCQQLAIAIENASLYTQTQDSKVYNDILLENLVSGVIACNRHGIITICNPRAQKIIEKPISSIIGHPLNTLPAQLSQILKDALETGHSEQDVEIAIEDKGHDPIFLSVGSSNFNSHTGENLGALLLVNDITALKQLQTQIRRTDRLASMGTLSAGMAHEIKNPLVTIKTFTQLLPDRYHDAEFRETFFSLMSDEVGRIDKIVNELLLFARPSQPVLENISIHEILTQSLRLVRQQLNYHNIQVQSDFTATQDVICGDSTLLSQAFVNFLLNAHDAMPNGGQLRLHTRKVYYNHLKKARKIPGASETDFIEINIDDSGEGIKESDLTHVFDPFFTTKSNGTGLGLSISHGIVEEHGGTIDIKSTAGAGTQLSVIFPLIKKESSL
jgi:signal transduction histidine kinase